MCKIRKKQESLSRAGSISDKEFVAEEGCVAEEGSVAEGESVAEEGSVADDVDEPIKKYSLRCTVDRRARKYVKY